MSDPTEALARELEKVWQKSPPVQHPSIGYGFLAVARWVLERYVPKNPAREAVLADARRRGLHGDELQLVERMIDQEIAPPSEFPAGEGRWRAKLREHLAKILQLAIAGEPPSAISDAACAALALLGPEPERDSHAEHLAANARLRAEMRAQGIAPVDERDANPEQVLEHVREHARPRCPYCAADKPLANLHMIGEGADQRAHHDVPGRGLVQCSEWRPPFTARGEPFPRSRATIARMLREADNAPDHALGSGGRALLQRVALVEERAGSAVRRVDLCVEHMEQRYAELERRVDALAQRVSALDDPTGRSGT